jgi:hypothetical protein
MARKRKNPFKGRKIRVRKAAKKIGAASKKAKSAAKRVLKNAAQKGKLAIIAPFRKAMEKQLRLRRIRVPKTLEEVARTFFAQVVRRNAYEEAAYFEGEENLVTVETEYNELDPVSISAIVSGIVSFFKKIQDKKKEGAPLTPAQEQLSKQLDEVERQVDTIKEEETDRTIGEMLQQYWWVAVILVLGIAYAATRK